MEECTLCTVCILKEINLDVRASLKKRKLRKNIYTELRRQGFILRLRQVYKELFTSFFFTVTVLLVRLLTLNTLQSKGNIVAKAMESKNPEMTLQFMG